MKLVKVPTGTGSRKERGQTQQVAPKGAPPQSSAMALPRESGALGENTSFFLDTKCEVHGPPLVGQDCHVHRQRKTCTSLFPLLKPQLQAQ